MYNVRSWYVHVTVCNVRTLNSNVVIDNHKLDMTASFLELVMDGFRLIFSYVVIYVKLTLFVIG